LDTEKDLTEEQKNEIKRIAKANADNFLVGWINRKTEPMRELLILSDTMFVLVYNEFGIQNKKTLKQWFVDSQDFTDPGIRGLIIRRFKELENRGLVFEDTGKVILNIF